MCRQITHDHQKNKHPCHQNSGREIDQAGSFEDFEARLQFLSLSPPRANHDSDLCAMGKESIAPTACYVLPDLQMLVCPHVRSHTTLLLKHLLLPVGSAEVQSECSREMHSPQRWFGGSITHQRSTSKVEGIPSD